MFPFVYLHVHDKIATGYNKKTYEVFAPEFSRRISLTPKKIFVTFMVA